MEARLETDLHKIVEGAKRNKSAWIERLENYVTVHSVILLFKLGKVIQIGITLLHISSRRCISLNLHILSTVPHFFFYGVAVTPIDSPACYVGQSIYC